MKYTKGFRGIKVEIVEVTREPFKVFWDWYKMTWSTLHNVAYDYHNPQIFSACMDVLNNRALPTPKEAVQVQFRVTGLSRVGLAQITRGRVGWAYNVLSQMPQPVQHNVTIPINIATKYEAIVERLVYDSQRLYDDLIKDGIPPQDARYVTLHGQQTDLIILTNYAALQGYFARRCENGLTDELNLVGRLLRRELVKIAKTSRQQNGWAHLLEKLDAMGADKQICVNTDRVFGNTGRFKSVGPQIPTPGTENAPDFDFTKSAWYYELQKLPDDLLFPGEKAMITRWKNGGGLLE